MSVRRSALPIAVSILLTACLGPVGRPITAPLPVGTDVQVLSARDTLMLRWTDAIAVDSARPHAARPTPHVTDGLFGIIERWF